MVLIAFVAALGFAAACAHIARIKNLHVASCAILGFVLPIAGLLIVLAEPPSVCPEGRFIASNR